MQVTFNTQNEKEVEEVVNLLQMLINTKNIAVKPTETVVEATKDENPTPTIPEPEKEPEKPKRAPRKKAEPKPEKSDVTLADLKELARAKVEVSSREEVKTIISKYAEKLAEVNESDYASLAKDLEV